MKQFFNLTDLSQKDYSDISGDCDTLFLRVRSDLMPELIALLEKALKVNQDVTSHGVYPKGSCIQINLSGIYLPCAITTRG